MTSSHAPLASCRHLGEILRWRAAYQPERTAFIFLADGETDAYDDELVAAVTDFQSNAGLSPDGVVGPATLAALNNVGGKISREDLIANMERWRWLPHDLGDFHVLVNIPEFRVAVVEDDQTVFSTRVVVGKPATPTPLFSNSIKNIVVNPYWNVPSSIIKGEIAPAVLRNPGYTDSHNMDLLYNGSPVSPWQVNWSQVSTSNFPFRVRQRPGAGNALGQIKFLFPNKHDVYLHDTPSKSLFARSYRAFSHGCIRVENPFEFADALMANETKISRASLEAMFGPTERWVNPEKQIPVHLAYFTLRVGQDGTIRSYGDVYGHNEKLIAAMGLALAPEFAGDRVAAFIHATADMIITAHGGKTEFFLLDGFDAQHLYNAARNVEIAVWMLAQRRNAQGQPLLLADEIGAQGRNLSYEREFGKVIARIDLLAAVTTEKYRRAAISYVQGIVGGTFLQFLPVR